MSLSAMYLLSYIPRIKGWFTSFKKQKRLYSNKFNKIAVIIPARNESAVIEDLLLSLENQTFPKEYFTTHIVIKDDNDKTITIAEKYNAIIHIAKDQTCKGDALNLCLKEIMSLETEYDYYVIIDADCMLHKEFLTEMNNATVSGADIIQAKKVVKNYLLKDRKANSLASMCNGLIWTIIDDMGNRYKADKGITGMTIGTGIMLSNKLVNRLGGWPYRQTLTEDMELMNDAAINNYSTFYYSYALMYLEESTSLKVTNKRRTRWLTGLIDADRIYRKKLKAAATTKKERRNRYFVTALKPVFKYIGTLTLGVLFFGITAIVGLITGIADLKAGFIYAGICCVVVYLSFLLLTLCCLIVERKNMPINIFKKAVLLFIHPIFYMGYIPIIAKALIFKANKDWEVIDRIGINMVSLNKDGDVLKTE